MPDQPTPDLDLDAIEAALTVYRHHPDLGFACCSAHPIADCGEALVAEVRRLRAELARQELLHGDTIDDRDRAQDAADKLAYAVASEDVIGEHTADNSPWANALDLITSKAEVDKLRRDLELAIAHDRQPYPTAWAYEQACKAREKHRERADAAEALIAAVRAKHKPRTERHGSGCVQCGTVWPCATHRDLDAAVRSSA
jgi:hypothetical protein